MSCNLANLGLLSGEMGRNLGHCAEKGIIGRLMIIKKPNARKEEKLV